MSEGTVVERNPPRDTIAVTEGLERARKERHTKYAYGGTRGTRVSNPISAILANDPPHGCSESPTVLLFVVGIDPAVECHSLIRVAELVVLPGVNEFMPNGGTELLPAVVFVGFPGQRDRDCLCCRVVLRDARLSLRSMWDFPVDVSTGSSGKCSAATFVACCCARSRRAVGVSGVSSVAAFVLIVNVRWSAITESVTWRAMDKNSWSSG
jgi:hypothetical protein